MWPRSELIELFGLEHPIVQAPMSGSDGPNLTASVSNAGALGSLGCGEMSVERVRENYARVRAQTSRPFNINFFTHHPPSEPSDGAAISRGCRAVSFPIALWSCRRLVVSPFDYDGVI